MRPVDVLCGFYFFPRGGSAYVTRYLGLHLPAERARMRLITGSLGAAGEISHAGSFFADLADVRTVDYTAAAGCYQRGDDPLLAPVPFHASYEFRGAVPDRLFAAAGPRMLAHQQQFWGRQFQQAGIGGADVVHLNHLTPQLGAGLDSGRPVIAHLHGTELKFLHQCLREGERCGPHAAMWVDYVRAHVPRVARLIAVSADDATAAAEILRVSPHDIDTIPNGVDLAEFARQPLSEDERRAQWRRWLVTDPLGWDESGRPGSVHYTESDLDALIPTGAARTLVLAVTRFLAFKRMDWLLDSWARTQSCRPPSTLVIWGGFPGEWEGEHPVSQARRLGLDTVLFTGFRGHEDLSVAMSCTDLLVNTSAREPFGLAPLQAMAATVPVLAAAAGGPAMYVRDGHSGWLFDPDDPAHLDKYLIDALASPAELARRGSNAAGDAAAYSWHRIADTFADLYTEVARTAPAARHPVTARVRERQPGPVTQAGTL
ncbi:glycosyltransferase family 4 protein [Nocardia sp. NBC_01388]|uniref:glycosyltransferase family 4 protein n=1 Tax=Nocardia sp. NBC_01388 TaxID=2903596 RepID=UPI00325679BE